MTPVAPFKAITKEMIKKPTATHAIDSLQVKPTLGSVKQYKLPGQIGRASCRERVSPYV